MTIVVVSNCAGYIFAKITFPFKLQWWKKVAHDSVDVDSYVLEVKEN